MTVYLAASPQTYSTKPYTGRGRPFRKGGSSYRRGGRDRDQSRPTPLALVTATKPSKSGHGHATMTITVPQDSKNVRFRVMRVLPMPNINVEPGSLKVIRNSQNEGVLPQLSVPVGGRLFQFVKGWKRITNGPWMLIILAKGYRLRFTSPPLLPKTPCFKRTQSQRYLQIF